MSLDPTILRSSFELVIDRRPDLTIRFYEILFARYPQLEPMFRRDRSAQAKMLAGAIAAVLDHLEDAPWLQTTLGGLGAKHVTYGVTDVMYAMVGDALLATGRGRGRGVDPAGRAAMEDGVRGDHDDDAGGRGVAAGLAPEPRGRARGVVTGDRAAASGGTRRTGSGTDRGRRRSTSP